MCLVSGVYPKELINECGRSIVRTYASGYILEPALYSQSGLKCTCFVGNTYCTVTCQYSGSCIQGTRPGFYVSAVQVF